MNAPLPAGLLLEELKPGMKASVPFVVNRDDMSRFAAISGDYNPLHVDDEFARAKGFEGAVVYGALLVAKVSQLIGMQLPGRDAVWASVALDFVKPLYVDQLAQVDGTVDSVSESTGMIAIKLHVRTTLGRLLAKGSAEVLLVGQ